MVLYSSFLQGKHLLAYYTNDVNIIHIFLYFIVDLLHVEQSLLEHMGVLEYNQLQPSVTLLYSMIDIYVYECILYLYQFSR